MIRGYAKKTDINMIRAIAAAVCGLALASCSSVSSNLPGFDRLTSPAGATLTIESTPPGAVARASNGGTCLTPCSLAVSVTDDFTVTYSLDGYVSQTVSVRSIPADNRALIEMTPPRLEPNPVLAELKPAPPPPKSPPVKKRQRQKPPPVARSSPPPPSQPGV
jgi:hypothetical protein